MGVHKKTLSGSHKCRGGATEAGASLGATVRMAVAMGAEKLIMVALRGCDSITACRVRRGVNAMGSG